MGLGLLLMFGQVFWTVLSGVPWFVWLLLLVGLFAKYVLPQIVRRFR